MDAQYLTGRMLIAMPAMADPGFAKSVVLICEHDENGALGFIVNRPAARLPFSEVLRQMDITASEATPEIAMHIGGPVDRYRGFVLHGEDWGLDEMTVPVADGLRMTATREILEAIAGGEGPRAALITIGYAGWGAGQLEMELQRNDWLIAPPNPSLIFDVPDAEKWKQALAAMGIDSRLLSAEGGTA